MTNDFGDPNSSWDEPGEQDWFDAAAAQGHLLIVRLHDAPQYFRTQNNPDGMVHPTRGATWDPFPNMVVRATVADLNLFGEDGLQGKIYKEAVIFPSSLTKPLKSLVGSRRLMMWAKVPSKPGQPPLQTDPYKLTNMASNDQAVAAAHEFLARHPEFDEIAAPEPYDGKPPVPQAPQYPPQGYFPQQWQGQQQGPAQGAPWQGQQQYPPAQPGYGQQQPQWAPPAPPQQPYPQQQQWQPDPYAQQQQAPQQQWQPQGPGPYGQSPQGPPSYQPPQQEPRQGSFLQQAQNHHGQPQQQQPPF